MGACISFSGVIVSLAAVIKPLAALFCHAWLFSYQRAWKYNVSGDKQSLLAWYPAHGLKQRVHDDKYNVFHNIFHRHLLYIVFSFNISVIWSSVLNRPHIWWVGGKIKVFMLLYRSIFLFYDKLLAVIHVYQHCRLYEGVFHNATVII